MIAQTETVNPVSAGEAIQPYYETWNHDDDDACQVWQLPTDLQIVTPSLHKLCKGM